MNAITQRGVVLEVPGMNRVSVQRNIPYRGSGPRSLCLDLYRPPETATEALPAVVFVTGYADPGAEKMFGAKLKDWGAYVGWARLVACHGMAAITYENEEPVSDVRLVLEHIRRNSTSLGIDASRLGVWSCSGNVPNALALLCDDARLRCAALCYGYMTDLDEFDEVAQAAAQFGFANPPCKGLFTSLAEIPIFLARAGKDEVPGLNASIDRFLMRALDENLQLSIVNYANGPHAFDILDASEGSRAVIRQILDFLQSKLLQ